MLTVTIDTIEGQVPAEYDENWWECQKIETETGREFHVILRQILTEDKQIWFGWELEEVMEDCFDSPIEGCCAFSVAEALADAKDSLEYYLDKEAREKLADRGAKRIAELFAEAVLD